MQAAAVAATELRCTLRRIRDHPKSAALRLLLLSLVVPSFVSGDALAGQPAAADARMVAAGLWTFIALTAALGAPRSLDDVRAGNAVLPAVGLRQTVHATLLTHTVEHGVFAGVVGVALFVQSVLGGAPAAGLLGLTAAVVGTTTAAVTGTALGIGLGPFLRRVPVANRYPQVVAVVPVVLVVFTVVNPDLVRPLLADLPPGWYADWFLVGTGGGSLQRAGAALVGTLVVLPIGVFCTERAADRVWFGDSSGGEQGGTTVGSRSTAAIVSLAAPVTTRPTRAVARRAWLRMLRNPRALVQLALPPFILVSVALQGSIDSRIGPAFIVLLAAASGGLTLTLNPLALEGNALPALLTTPVAGGRVVRGYVLAGLLGAGPALLLAAIVAQFLADLSLLFVVCAVVWGFVVAAAGAAISTSLGFVLPSLDALADGSATSPTRAAVFAYMFTMFLVGAPGLGGLVALPNLVGVLAVVGDVALLAAVGGVAYWHAGQRFAELTV
ncbi:hypothetical protein [Haloarchaeobius sp. DFWS5]|uniref:hypothetical protein n=1 Tax=Haloarchaeobius sp. DFWS5 TaxID=3446114 RepID=UPI003EBC8E0B